jgi:hypothetical protein
LGEVSKTLVFSKGDQMKKLDFYFGTIHSAIDQAIAESAACGEQCQFEFNGVTVVVAGDSNAELIYRDWDRGMRRYIGKNPTIGPYPKAELSAEEIASDAAIRAEHERLSAIRQEEYAKAARDKKKLLEGALSVAGPIELANEAGWKTFVEANKDGYGGRVVRYAEEWARLMQTRIANGETIPQCAQELSHLADDDGITGFMYGCAVSVLSKTWKHGEALRRWHNKETQIGTEGDKANESGGVLNPALLNIG